MSWIVFIWYTKDGAHALGFTMRVYWEYHKMPEYDGGADWYTSWWKHIAFGKEEWLRVVLIQPKISFILNEKKFYWVTRRYLTGTTKAIHLYSVGYIIFL